MLSSKCNDLAKYLCRQVFKLPGNSYHYNIREYAGIYLWRSSRGTGVHPLLLSLDGGSSRSRGARLIIFAAGFRCW